MIGRNTRLADEAAALPLVATHDAIPFDPCWLEMSRAAGSAQVVATLLAQRAGNVSEAISMAEWLRMVSNELIVLVTNEQVRRARELADAQAAAIAQRKAERRHAAEASAEEALAALDALIDEVF